MPSTGDTVFPEIDVIANISEIKKFAVIEFRRTKKFAVIEFRKTKIVIIA